MSFIAELKRRNVFRVSAAYIVGAWAVAQVADLAFGSFDAPPWAMQALLILLLIGLPIVAIAAWALELGPDGLQLDDDGEADPKYQNLTRRRLNITIVALLAVSLGLATFTILKQREPSDTAELAQRDQAFAAIAASRTNIAPSIAVLPFDDMSASQDQQHLADGVATELMTALHRVDKLRVVSRTSAFALRDSGKNVQEIAEILNVDHIVEGSVSRFGDQVKIEAALVDVRGDVILWSESYTQPLGDAFALQAGITRKIAAALRVVVGDETGSAIDSVFEATANPAAYEAFLKGHEAWAQRGAENIRQAIEYFETALELEPNFARAEAALANAYITLPSYAFFEDPAQWRALTTDAWKNATVHAQNALTLDPTLVEAYSALADLARIDGRWDDARRLYLQGLEIDPRDVTLNLWYSEYLQDVGQLEKALAQNQYVLELDLLSPGANTNLVGGYLALGDCKAMEAPARRAVALGHDFGYFGPILCAVSEQRWKDA